MAPGFRFYPTEDELLSFYLRNKLEQKISLIDRVIPVFDIYQLEPWQLPQHCGELCHGDTEQWFFFVPRKEREVRGGRPSRTTSTGYWKATGSPSHVYSSENKVIGLKKSMVFYKGKTPTGRKTKWKMNEYRAIEQDTPTSTPKLRHELSLCRIYVGSGTVRSFDRRPTIVSEPGSSGEINAIEENDGDIDDTDHHMNAPIVSFATEGNQNTNDDHSTDMNVPIVSFATEGNQNTNDDHHGLSMENNTSAGGGGGLFSNLEDLMDWENMHVITS